MPRRWPSAAFLSERTCRRIASSGSGHPASGVLTLGSLPPSRSITRPSSASLRWGRISQPPRPVYRAISKRACLSISFGDLRYGLALLIRAVASSSVRGRRFGSSSSTRRGPLGPSDVFADFWACSIVRSGVETLGSSGGLIRSRAALSLPIGGSHASNSV